jgi:glutaredoxin-related protein
MNIMIYKKRCPECNKEIKSLYENQLEYNYNQHLESHKRKLPKSKDMIKEIKEELK